MIFGIGFTLSKNLTILGECPFGQADPPVINESC